MFVYFYIKLLNGLIFHPFFFVSLKWHVISRVRVTHNKLGT